MFCHRDSASLCNPVPADRRNIAVDKSYKTKVKVMVRNITPKARSSNTRTFAAPNQPLEDILV
jgi:hypothetical protein